MQRARNSGCLTKPIRYVNLYISACSALSVCSHAMSHLLTPYVQDGLRRAALREVTLEHTPTSLRA